MHVNQYTFTLLIDEFERLPYLIAAITTLRSEDIAGQTLGMHAHQHALRAAYVPLYQSHMFGNVNFVAVDDRLVHSPVNRREDFFGHAFDQAFIAQAISDEVRH